MRRIKFVNIFAALIFIIGAKAAQAEIWKAPVWFDDGAEQGRVFVGASSTCTDKYDPLEEMDAYFAGNMKTYFYHPEWGRSKAPGGTDYYWSDIRSATYPQTWTIYISDNRSGRNVNITWDITQAKTAIICENIRLELTDPSTGQVVAMTDGASYTYTNTSTAAKTFTVAAMQSAPAVKLDAPANLSSNPGQGAVVLHWNNAHDVAGYRVYRAEAGGAFNLISGDKLVVDDNNDDIVEFLDKSLVKGKKNKQTTYTYAVIAVDERGCAGNQAVVNVER